MKLKPVLSGLAKVTAIGLALTVLGYLVLNAQRNANPEPPPDEVTEAQPPERVAKPGDPGEARVMLPSSKVLVLSPEVVAPAVPTDATAPPSSPFLFSSKSAPILEAQPGSAQAGSAPVRSQPVFLPSSKIGRPGIVPRLALPPPTAEVKDKTEQ